eukprot:505795-Lingulodinium_polyedra.AAC.1
MVQVFGGAGPCGQAGLEDQRRRDGRALVRASACWPRAPLKAPLRQRKADAARYPPAAARLRRARRSRL